MLLVTVKLQARTEPKRQQLTIVPKVWLLLQNALRVAFYELKQRSRVLSAHAQGIFVKLSVAIALTITAILVVTNAALGSQEGAV